MGTHHKGVGEKQDDRVGFLPLEGMNGAEFDGVYVRMINQEEGL